MTRAPVGHVYVVGAGPGDPGLLTRRGAECLSFADVVVYDSLANASLLDLAPAEAERVYVGKRGGKPSTPQGDINELLVKRARRGLQVVRLKGGDPFVFARGGEEARHLHRHGVPFEVVAGVTSGTAAPLYAGIPLTDRRHAATVAFVTGHEDPTKPESQVDWSALARIGTLVIFMGVRRMPDIMDALQRAGRAPDEPVATIEWATTAQQRTVVGTVGTIAELAAREDVAPPAIIVVGDVVGLRDRLGWFDTRPLFRRRILVTRSRTQAGRFSQMLRAAGAEAIEIPTIAFRPVQSGAPLRDAVTDLDAYDWVVFTSQNAIRYFWDALEQSGGDTRALAGLRIAVSGKGTAAFLQRYGVRADLVPERYVSESLAEALIQQGVGTRRVLLPRARVARQVLPDSLRQAGADVVVVPAYESYAPASSAALLSELGDGPRPDLITVASSATMRYFDTMLREHAADAWRQVPIAAIGPITAATARDLGYRVDVVPERSTLEDLRDAIIEHLAAKSST